MAVSRETIIQAADAINAISEFVAHEQLHTPIELRDALLGLPNDARKQIPQTKLSSVGVVVLCASAVISTAETVIPMVTELVETSPQHPEYSRIASQVSGQPEARILEVISEQFFHLTVEKSDQGPPGGIRPKQGLTVLVEDASTNCALNAINTRKVLEAHGCTSPASIVVAQDPTMCRRTVAAFEKVYADKMHEAPMLASWPTFIPRVIPRNGPYSGQVCSIASSLVYDVPGWDEYRKDRLWSMERFMSLLVGEIPRMRDDENGYGPRGKGSIVHVEIPPKVEEAWQTLCDLLGQKGR
ncbi:DUF218 domain-containing protein [Fusarium heterosporum]|uniref:DUF218 domain-containing protein n=1 Tax=Fusarium heterosporum TaxID=42747 RepID=A0A8H5TQQ0_FUSHE|nr:DUF218 domain-containing protein [Fusarium heterosporum]